jgi:predicted membrane protein
MFSLLSLKSFMANNINSIQILMCIVGATICLLPLHFYDSYAEKFELHKSIRTTEFVIFSTVSLGLAAPLILDFLIDQFIYTSKERNIHSKSIGKVLFVTDVEQIIFIFGTLMVPIIAVIPESSYLSHKMTFTYICCARSQYLVSLPFECCL